MAHFLAQSLDSTEVEEESATKEKHKQTQTITSETTEAETQTASASKMSEVEVQTDEFEYLFSTTKIQPFTEDYFRDSVDKVRFYTGLPGFDVLKHVVEFVASHATRKSKTLTSFQEIIMVMMKLRLNVPKQDLAFRFEVSLSTVSRIFSSWMIVLDVRLSPLITWPDREELWRTMCF